MQTYSSNLCNHGFWLKDCAICEKRSSECDYGSCTEPASHIVVQGSERRPMCTKHAPGFECLQCGGQGELEKPLSRDEFGNWDTEMVRCNICHGTGELPELG